MTFGIISLFILSILAPMTFGIDIDSKEKSVVENFDRYLYPEYYDSYNNDEIPSFIEYQNYDVSTNHGCSEAKESNPIEIIQLLDGPMDSPWPMYCHDVRHTGRSPYSTAGNVGFDKWWFKTDYGFIEGSGVIDKDGVIYFGSWNNNLYAFYTNGTMKWKCDVGGNVRSSPAIDENGVIYVGDDSSGGGKLCAIYPNGTIKWKYYVYDTILSSPAIGNDGTIYFGDGNHNINALYPNGTLKWCYKTNFLVYSSPAIGDDGTVYCGSHDTNLYALYPNNGTLKWKYKTGHWIRTSPCIGDDGTIYCVSLDGYLHALYPNGTRKWRTGVGGGTSPTIGHDGTIYCGWDKLYAINPDGSVKWSFNPGSDRCIEGATPCTSSDGTIYFGTRIDPAYGGEIIAVNPDGTEKWRKMIANDLVGFAPVIGEDGTVYIGSSTKEETRPGAFISVGYLYAFNKKDDNAPLDPLITGPSRANSRKEINYTFKSTSPLGNDVYFYVDWGDGEWKIDWWLGPFGSGENAVISHTWSEPGTYTIKSRCNDSENLWSDWSEFKVTIPRNRAYSNTLLLRLIEQFPILQNLLYLLQ